MTNARVNEHGDCTACVAAKGLCQRHVDHETPQLAVNLGWLRMMGETHIEQRRRQRKSDEAEQRQVARAQRRDARKHAKLARRGYGILLMAAGSR